MVYDASNVLRSRKSKAESDDEPKYPYDLEESRTSSLDELDKEENRLLGSDPELADTTSVESGHKLHIRQRSKGNTGPNKNSINSTPSGLESQLNDDEAL